MSTFASLGVSAPVAAALARRGILEPFPIQEQVLPAALAGRDVLAMAPTGSGKTISFALPIVERIDDPRVCPAALILVPTRELAAQVADEIAKAADGRRLRVAVAVGGMPMGRQVSLARRAQILVATPGRLFDLVERGLVRLDGVSMLVLDEADRMLDMGFQPQVDRIVAVLPSKRQTMFFSATLQGAVGSVAARYTNDPLSVAVEAIEEDRPDIEHRFRRVTADGKIDALVDLLGDERDLALVFVRTRHGADRLARRLEKSGVRAVALHGDMSQNQRTRALKSFSDGGADTLVATDVAARGLDVSGVSHVVNFDPPQDHETYTHRVGRTGRAGKSGIGYTLVLPDQSYEVAYLAKKAGVDATCDATGEILAPVNLDAAGGKGGQRRRGGPPPSRNNRRPHIASQRRRDGRSREGSSA